MKSTLLMLTGLVLLPATGARAQEQTPVTSGTVRYEEKAKIEVKLEGDAAQFANMLPKERKSGKLLYFNQEAALYVNDKKDSEEENMSWQGEGAMVAVKMVEPDNKMYTDLKGGKLIEQREFMTRMFLIEGEMEAEPWKMTGNSREILGFACQEAVMEKDSVRTVAWFAPSIPVPAGPATYNNLPGLILAMDIDDGKRTINAVSVDRSPVDKSLLVKPKEGKKVTKDEFRKIMDEKMKEMGAEHGEGRGEQIMIRISR